MTVINKAQETLEELLVEAGNCPYTAMEMLQGVGICTACGEETGGCEPDAQHYECPHCGEFHVTGAETLLMELV